LNSKTGRVTFARTFGLVVVMTVMGSGCAFLSGVTQTDPSVTTSEGTTGRASATADGKLIAYAANTDASAPGVTDGIYVLDASTRIRQLVSVASDGTPGDGISSDAVISADGRYVAFTSDSTNLVAGDTNLVDDVFVRDRTNNVTTRVSVTTAGVEVADPSYAPSISADGRYVSYTSDSDELVAIGDENGSSDTYVHDMVGNATILVSVGPAGLQTDFGAWDPAISGNGQWVAFTTDTALVASDENDGDDIYERDILHNTIRRISGPKSGTTGGGGDNASVNTDGNTVVFQSDATDLTGTTDTNNATDIFGRLTASSVTFRISNKKDGTSLVGSSTNPSVSADGFRTAYQSTGDPSGTDTNGTLSDVFVHDRAHARTLLVSTKPWLDQLPYPSLNAAISGDGRYAYWLSIGPFTGDTNGVGDMFDRAVDVPRPTAISPTSLTHGTSAKVTITGTDFLPKAAIWLPANLTAGTVTVLSDTSMTVTITAAANATLGLTDIFVQNLGSGGGPNTGAMGQCSKCLTVK
jgi:Periplasmic component of the Tol biopolymer transport system